jgi:hypothetical protein
MQGNFIPIFFLFLALVSFWTTSPTITSFLEDPPQVV